MIDQLWKREKKGIGNIVGVPGVGDQGERGTIDRIGNTFKEERGFRGKINSVFDMLILSCCQNI